MRMVWYLELRMWSLPIADAGVDVAVAQPVREHRMPVVHLLANISGAVAGLAVLEVDLAAVVVDDVGTDGRTGRRCPRSNFGPAKMSPLARCAFGSRCLITSVGVFTSAGLADVIVTCGAAWVLDASAAGPAATTPTPSPPTAAITNIDLRIIREPFPWRQRRILNRSQVVVSTTGKCIRAGPNGPARSRSCAVSERRTGRDS